MPYIDVMLVLLIIFMVVPPANSPSVINLPSAEKSALPPDDYIQVVLKPNATLSIGVNGKNSSAPQDMPDRTAVLRALRTLHADHPEYPVMIAGDKRQQVRRRDPADFGSEEDGHQPRRTGDQVSMKPRSPGRRAVHRAARTETLAGDRAGGGDARRPAGVPVHRRELAEHRAGRGRGRGVGHEDPGRRAAAAAAAGNRRAGAGARRRRRRRSSRRRSNSRSRRSRPISRWRSARREKRRLEEERLEEQRQEEKRLAKEEKERKKAEKLAEKKAQEAAEKKAQELADKKLEEKKLAEKLKADKLAKSKLAAAEQAKLDKLQRRGNEAHHRLRHRRRRRAKSTAPRIDSGYLASIRGKVKSTTSYAGNTDVAGQPDGGIQDRAIADRRDHFGHAGQEQRHPVVRRCGRERHCQSVTTAKEKRWYRGANSCDRFQDEGFELIVAIRVDTIPRTEPTYEKNPPYPAVFGQRAGRRFPAAAQVRVEIAGVASNQIPVAVATFADESVAPAQMSAIIRADLERSGVFKVIDSRRRAVRDQPPIDYGRVEIRAAPTRWWSAACTASPTAASTCATSCSTRSSGRSCRRCRRSSAAAVARLAAHRIADDVYEKLTGERGVFSTRIAYVTKRGNRYELRDGRRRRRRRADRAALGNEPIISPAWSPDGTQARLRVVREAKPVVYVQDLATGAAPRRRELKGQQLGAGLVARRHAPGGDAVARRRLADLHA